METIWRRDIQLFSLTSVPLCPHIYILSSTLLFWFSNSSGRSCMRTFSSVRYFYVSLTIFFISLALLQDQFQWNTHSVSIQEPPTRRTIDCEQEESSR
jgi:hypothetical protein